MRWQHGPGSSTIAGREAQLRGLEDVYILRPPAEVRRFLNTQPELIDFLLDAYAQLQSHFGPGVQAALEVVRDPEVENSEKLFAYILSPLPVDEALARLDALDEDWFLDQLDRVGGRFNFNLQFV